MKALYDLYGKKLLSLTILLLLILSLLSVLNVNITRVSALDSPWIKVIPENTVDPTLTPGQNYTVSIYTDYDGEDIYAYQFTLSYNPDVLHGGVNNTDTWDGDGVTNVFNTTKTPVVPYSDEVYVNKTLMLRDWNYAINYTTSEITFKLKTTDTWDGDGVTNVFNTTKTPVVPYSDEVYVNKTLMLRDWNYTIDYGIGEITFIRNVPGLGAEIEAAYNAPPGLGADITAMYLYNGVTNGDLIVGGSAQLYVGPFNNTVGKLSRTVGIFYKEGEVASGPGTLANVTFTVVGKGKSNITIGPETKLKGWDDWEEEDYDIIYAVDDPTHIQHGYFDNRFPHDVAVVSLNAQAETTVGSRVSINVTVANIGKSDEVANVTILYDSTYIDSQNVQLLAGASETTSFTWDTAGVAQGTYTIKATATIPVEDDPTDNWDTTTFLVAHDVAVVGVTAPDKAAVGSSVPITVEVANVGSFAEVANVTVCYDSTLIDFNDAVVLPTQNSTIVPFSWDTTGATEGEHTINATATIEGDLNPIDNWNTTTIRLVAHDVAVVGVTAPDKAAVGSSVPITVEVTNRGASNETVDVAISYDGIPIETKSIPLLVGESDTVSFSWDTTGATEGEHTIDATATIPWDGDLTDNWKNTTIRLLEHDVAVKSILVTPDTAIPGEIVSIGVEIENIGAFAEVANVTVCYDSTCIDTQNVTLLVGESKTVSFDWDTTGVAQGNYTLNATATIPEDDDPTDNWKNATILIAMHDVAVQSISAPISVYVGELATIGVLVKNLGWYEETFDVKVTYDTTGIIESPKSVTLLSKDSEHSEFSWNTTGVAPASYTITAEVILDGDTNPTNNKKTRDNPVTVELPPGAIAGTVTDSSNNNPIEGANVTANGYSDITDDNGHYNIADVPAGTYNVTASANGYQTSSSTDIIVDTGETTTVNFELTPLGNITGKVIDASTRDPIAGATVTADGNSATTDANGEYTLPNVLPGDYTVTASAAKYLEQSKTVTLTAGTTTTLNFELTLLNGTISGTVKDSSTGNPISEATVIANGMSATTDSSGTYVISDVPVGTYNVTVSADGYQSSSQTDITVTAGETTIADFELTPVQPLNLLLYAGVAAVAIVFIAGTAVYIFKIRKPT